MNFFKQKNYKALFFLCFYLLLLGGISISPLISQEKGEEIEYSIMTKEELKELITKHSEKFYKITDPEKIQNILYSITNPNKIILPELREEVIKNISSINKKILEFEESQKISQLTSKLLNQNENEGCLLKIDINNTSTFIKDIIFQIFGINKNISDQNNTVQHIYSEEEIKYHNLMNFSKMISNIVIGGTIVMKCCFGIFNPWCGIAFLAVGIMDFYFGKIVYDAGKNHGDLEYINQGRNSMILGTCCILTAITIGFGYNTPEITLSEPTMTSVEYSPYYGMTIIY